MSWTDKIAVETFLKIRDIYNIQTFFETGTFKGINAQLHAKNFNQVITCEKVKEYYEKSKERLKDYRNIKLIKGDSARKIRKFRKEYEKENRTDIIFFYLDAHFYDSKLPKKDKWQVVKELKALKGFKNCVIAIHDFAINSLGHCCYNGECLDWKLIGKDLMKVNPDFQLYVNDPDKCNILNENDFRGLNIPKDDDVLDNLFYANSSERLRKRGIIYALPNKQEIMNEFRP